MYINLLTQYIHTVPPPPPAPKATAAMKKTKAMPPPPPTSMAMKNQAPPGLAKPTGISKTGMYFIY